MLRPFFAGLTVVSFLVGCGESTPPAPTAKKNAASQQADEAAIRKNVESYVAAFNKGDAKAMADHWSENGVSASHTNGEWITGREAVQSAFQITFEERGEALLDVSVESIRFVTPDVAVEDGTATVLRAGELPDRSAYTAIHVKKGGKWLIDSIQENDLPEPPSNYYYLKDLEWMVGETSDEKEKVIVKTVCDWAFHRNFLRRSFTVAVDKEEKLQGTQLIGWDAAAQEIRSWAFDSHGGYAEPEWSAEKNAWVIGDKTLIEAAREKAVAKAPSRYQHLKDLEWMVGQWVDDDEDATVLTICNWAPGKNLLTRSFTVSVQDQIEMRGIQVIGWNEAKKQIRAWVFDSTGGFGEAVWKQDGKRWVARVSQILGDGARASSINIMTQLDVDSFTFQSTGREVDGELLPGIAPVKIVRKASQPANQ